MVDIQSATAEISRGIKKRRKKKKPQDKNIMSAPAAQGGHNYTKNESCSWTNYFFSEISADILETVQVRNILTLEH